MRRKKWYFQRGERYLLDEVITACDIRLREGGVKRVESKSKLVRRMEKYAPPTHRLVPKERSGLGRFAIQRKLLALGRGRWADSRYKCNGCDFS